MSIEEKSKLGLRKRLVAYLELLNADAAIRQSREASWLPLAVCILAVVWFATANAVAPYVADDSFILFRHVKHLLMGQGAIWDAAHPIEAHSSPSWVLLLAVVSTLGVSLPDAGVWLGIAFSASAIMLLMTVLRDLGTSWTGVALVAVVATNPSVTTWTNAGLEMPLALFAVIAFVYCTDSLWRQPSAGALAALIACSLLSSSIRPDLPLQFIACIIALCFLPGAPRRTLLVGLAAIVIGSVILALWRYNYYGDYLALPQRAKSVVEPLNLLRYARYLLAQNPLLILVGLSVPLLWFRSRLRPQPAELVATLLAAAIMSEHALLGGDELTRGRFAVQPLALLMISIARPLASVASRHVFGAIIAVGGGLLIQVWFALHPLPDGDQLCGEWREEVGHWLASNSTPDFSIASTSAGYIPYYADRPALDLYGLTHPDMARLTVRRGSTEYGYEVARIAVADEVCAFIVPVCGSASDATCPLPAQSHRLLAGIISYLDATPSYEAAVVELESKRNLIVYVRDTCRDRVSGVRYCGSSSGAGC